MKLGKADDMSLSSTSIRGATYSTFQSASTKYNGLVELSTYKKMRNLLFELMRYIYSSVSTSSAGLQTLMKIVNVIMMCIRFLQLYGPSLNLYFHSGIIIMLFVEYLNIVLYYGIWYHLNTGLMHAHIFY